MIIVQWATILIVANVLCVSSVSRAAKSAETQLPVFNARTDIIFHLMIALFARLAFLDVFSVRIHQLVLNACKDTFSILGSARCALSILRGALVVWIVHLANNVKVPIT